MGWSRAPLVRFVTMGAILYAVSRWRAPAPIGESPVPRSGIVITAAQVEHLREAYARDTGLPLTPEAEAALVRRAIDDELLYREALARGLDRNDRSIEWRLAEGMQFLNGDTDDPMDDRRAQLANAAFAVGLDRADVIVRRMLIEKMRLLAVHNGTQTPPSDAEIRTYFEQHAEQFRSPERFSFWHVFLARERRRDLVERDAHALRDQLQRERISPAAAMAYGDGFAVAPHVVAQSPPQLRSTFGAAFADAVAQCPPQEWTGPIASPYGRHLVWMEERTPAQLPPIAEVRSRIVRSLRAAQREEIVRGLIAELERVYTVRVEPAQRGSS